MGGKRQRKHIVLYIGMRVQEKREREREKKRRRRRRRRRRERVKYIPKCYEIICELFGETERKQRKKENEVDTICI